MKNKKMIAVLVAFALLQLMFPGAVVAYERSFKKAVVEKGEAYTLDFDGVSNFNKDGLAINKYKVKFGGDYDKNRLAWDESAYFPEVIIEKNSEGVCTLYDYGTEGKIATDYNLFPASKAFMLDFEDYEFVLADFGMKELFELCRYLCYDDYGAESYEEFINPEHGYSALHEIDLDGKAVLCVYKGMVIIKELYIGEDLILKHK